MRALLRFLRRVTVDQWRAIDDECREEAQREDQAAQAGASVPDARKAPGRKRGKPARSVTTGSAGQSPAAAPAYDWRVIVVLVIVCVSLALQEYYGERTYYQTLFPPDRSDPYWTLKGFVWWSGWRVFGYLVLPAIAILCMPGERLRDYFVSPRGFFRHMWIYVGLFLIVLPAVLIAGQSESFYRTYPFYKFSNRSPFDFWAWQALYAAQFLSLEFFFRGFMLRGLRRTMGSKAIFVMVVPYCMIHFGKPFPETMGAVIAGIVLGTLAMRTKSIWGGVIIHVAVALTMDLLALSHCPAPEMGMPCKGH